MTGAAQIPAQAQALAQQGRFAEALTLTAAGAARPDAAPALLTFHANLLKALGRMDEAVAAARRSAAAAPHSMAGRHNLAAMLGDADLNAEAEAAAREAFALGGDAPETWLVLGRALQGQNRFDEAEAAYREAVNRRPAYGDALKDLSQLIWMRGADLAAALAPLDTAIAAAPADGALRIVKARLMDYAGDPRGAYQVLSEGPMDSAGRLTAAQSALKFDPDLALTQVQAVATGPTRTSRPVRLTLAECLLAVGRPAEALVELDALSAQAPLDQYLIALRATALRLLGREAAYRALYDYDAFVRPAVIDTPPGWSSLETYLADLAVALRDLHGLKTHPVGQSLRGGSQTTAALSRSDHPAIRAFFTAIDGPIRAYMAAVGSGSDPLRARNTGAYAIAGSWSVRLRPNGFHADHVHPQGWLSSACYIDLPAAVSDRDRQGWIQFGRPAIATRPPLEAEHAVRPAPGTLVLFPSYMWHGTVPFTGEDERLTIAFDVVPA